MNLRPRRRDVLLGGLAVAAAGRRSLAEPRTFNEAIVVDVHCHDFAAKDLPLVGFVAHFIPGLTDFSSEIWQFPERVVRAILKAASAIPKKEVPTADEEIQTLEKAMADGAFVAPVPDLSAAKRQEVLSGVLKYLPFLSSLSSSTKQMLDRYLDTIYLTSHARSAIAASLSNTYPTVALFTPCLVDFDAWSNDAAETPLADQIRVQSVMAKASMKGLIGTKKALFHPFVAFDPRREVKHPSTLLTAAPAANRDGGAPDGGGGSFVGLPDVCRQTVPATINAGSGPLDMVAYAVEKAGFLGAKIYPPVGFAPIDNVGLRPGEADSAKVDAALRGLYTYCQTREVPITTHTSPGNEYGLGFRDLVEAKRWRPVLAAYPGLRVNLGHFGHETGIDKDRGISACEAWCYQICDLITRYPNVYTDVADSAAVNDEAYLTSYGGYLKQMFASYPKLKKRLMYGSDWWLNRFEEGADNFPTAIPRLLGVAGLSADEIADVMGRNALRFLGFIDDNNKLVSGLAAKRLRVFYDGVSGATPPAWLS